MKGIHPPIVEIALHYAEQLKDVVALDILRGRPIGTDERARAFMRFLSALVDRAIEDEKNGKMVRGQKALASDGEKVYLVLEDFVEDEGFGHVLDDLGD
jgi:hypothetical protein